MTSFRFTAGWRVCAAGGLLFVLGACAATAGVAVRGSSGTTTTAGTSTTTAGTSTTTANTTPTSATTPTAATSGSTPRSLPVTTPPVSSGTTPSGPPVCGGTINKLVTPTGSPVITVTAGANFFIANLPVEPLSLAVYSDGTALSSMGVGTATEPLPRMTMGYVPICTLEWAKKEIEQLAEVDLGQPNVTDQGTTEVVYRRSDGPSIHLSAYALGIDDKYALTGKEGRARLTTLLAALRAPLAGATTWIPDRLRVIEVPAPRESAGPALSWPAQVGLDQVLTDRRFNSRCGVVAGAQAAAVLKALGDRAVHSRWTDAGKATGLNIGALVPGQSGCGQG